MLLNGGAPWRFNQISKIVYLFLQKIGVGEQLGDAGQRDGMPQLEQKLQRMGDVDFAPGS